MMIVENVKVNLPLLTQKGITLYIKRDDKNHPIISGNKLRKLKYNLLEAKKLQKDTLLTFGGAYSNHIVATAGAGLEQGFKTIGIIRGDELGKDIDKALTENPSLRQAHQMGMQFKFVTRSDYRKKTTKAFISDLIAEFGDCYLVPEGGTNDLAVKGCEEILTKADENFDYITSAIGTGGTISGIINSTTAHQKVLGFPALKGDFHFEEIKKYTSRTNWDLVLDYHFGGFAKVNTALISFMNMFYKETNIPLDPIYTGKMLFGLLDLIKNDYFAANTKILAIHTGGLQGILGMNTRLLKKNQSIINYE
jgi:1-aminocyclopropane-1-carboxylate deaminase